MAAPPDREALAAICAPHGQGHLLEDWDALTSEQRAELARDIQALDFGFIARALAASEAAAGAVHAQCQPVQDVTRVARTTPEQRASWQDAGLRLIAAGKVGVLLLAGGQGTRLGSAAPKGCYDVGLPSGRSLFQLHAERLLAVQRLAAAAAPAAAQQQQQRGSAEQQVQPLHWFIMTSPFTHEATLRHFEAGAFFGLTRQQVHFFQQGFLPCLTPGGQVILEGPSRVAKAPDGNGGLYRALTSSGTLPEMQALGIEALDVLCVDNILARPADPAFLGACWAGRAQLGARVLAKASPGEKVGVFARDARGGLQVLEYSELDPAQAGARDPGTGQLLFNWSNICMHYFRLDWLAQAAAGLEEAATYHIARKQIPAKGGAKVPGLKLEMFIFDPFHTASSSLLYEVAREEHFAPVKNAPGSGADSPEAARDALLAQGTRWVAAAGGRLGTGVTGVEVSPLLSYAGEGLEARVRGKELAGPGPVLLQ